MLRPSSTFLRGMDTQARVGPGHGRIFQGKLKGYPNGHKAGHSRASPGHTSILLDLSLAWTLVDCWDPEAQGHWPMDQSYDARAWDEDSGGGVIAGKTLKFSNGHAGVFLRTLCILSSGLGAASTGST